MTANRRLAAIMVADVVGYSRMMEADEAGTIAAWRGRRTDVIEPVIQPHGGRIVKLMGATSSRKWRRHSPHFRLARSQSFARTASMARHSAKSLRTWA